MYYSHGERSVFISNESHKKICRVLCRGQNVDKCILDILSNSVPELVSSAASKIVSKECQRLCKRGSGSILQTKSYDSIFRFTWDELNKEIQIRAPNMHYHSSYRKEVCALNEYCCNCSPWPK